MCRTVVCKFRYNIVFMLIVNNLCLKRWEFQRFTCFSQNNRRFNDFFIVSLRTEGKRAKLPFHAPTHSIHKDRVCQGLFRQEDTIIGLFVMR